MIDIRQSFSAKLWASDGPSSWHFVTLPNELADEIKFFKANAPGFGTVRASITVGNSQWSTSLFPDKASGSYFLPIKAAIRKQEHLHVGDTLCIEIAIHD